MSNQQFGDTLLSDDEITALVLALRSNGRNQGESAEDIEIVLDWAREVKTLHAMLDNILDGRVVPVIVNGEIEFSLTDAGKERAEEIIREQRENGANA